MTNLILTLTLKMPPNTKNVFNTNTYQHLSALSHDCYNELVDDNDEITILLIHQLTFTPTAICKMRGFETGKFLLWVKMGKQHKMSL